MSIATNLGIVCKAIHAGSATQAEHDLFTLALAVRDISADVWAVEHAIGASDLAVVGKVEVGAGSLNARVGREHVHESHDDDVHFGIVAVVAQRLFVLRTERM